MGIDSRLEQYPLGEIEQFYDESMPYHNFGHACNVTSRALLLADRCTKYGIAVREPVVVWSGLFHDAGYHIDPKTRGFPTREDHSAAIARIFLQGRRIPERVTDEVFACIISTNRDAPFLFVEQKIVRAADLAGLAGTYEEFKANNFRLKREYEMLSGKEITVKDWIDQTKKIVEFYLSENIVLTPEHQDANGRSIFHTRAQHNLDLLLKEHSR